MLYNLLKIGLIHPVFFLKLIICHMCRMLWIGSTLSDPDGSLMEDRVSLELEEHTKFSVWVSFCEIYNENIHDLLEPLPTGATRRSTLRLSQDVKGNLFVKGRGVVVDTVVPSIVIKNKIIIITNDYLMITLFLKSTIWCKTSFFSYVRAEIGKESETKQIYCAKMAA